jgi:hypothetical protein
MLRRLWLFWRCLILAKEEIERLQKENAKLRLLAAEQVFIDRAAQKWKSRKDGFEFDGKPS